MPTTIGGTGNATTSRYPAPAPASSEMTMDSFMKLLSIQLQNQDFNNPMSNSEMMQQLTSMATVQAMNTFTELSSTQYALGLMGQEVTVAAPDSSGALSSKVGKVVGINLGEMKVYLENDKVAYGIGNVMEVGTVPKKEDEGEEEEGETDSDSSETEKKSLSAIPSDKQVAYDKRVASSSGPGVK